MVDGRDLWLCGRGHHPGWLTARLRPCASNFCAPTGTGVQRLCGAGPGWQDPGMGTLRVAWWLPAGPGDRDLVVPDVDRASTPTGSTRHQRQPGPPVHCRKQVAPDRGHHCCGPRSNRRELRVPPPTRHHVAVVVVQPAGARQHHCSLGHVVVEGPRSLLATSGSKDHQCSLAPLRPGNTRRSPDQRLPGTRGGNCRYLAADKHGHLGRLYSGNGRTAADLAGSRGRHGYLCVAGHHRR